MIGEEGQGREARRSRFHPELKKGQRFRFVPDGPLYEVAVVTAGAASPRRVYATPELVTLPDGTEIRMSRGKVEPGISLYSKVYPE